MAVEQTVLVTGGSAGIGLTISTYFAQAGYRLLWVSFSEEELATAKQQLQAQFSSCQVDSKCLDLSAEGAAQKVYSWVQDNKWVVDVVINNAGVGSYGFVNEINLQKELAMIHLNVMSVYAITHLFLEDMVARNQGTIINISSNTSFYPTPKLSTYGATKAFVTHFSRSLREELKMKKSKVKVICVCPAAIRNTNFKTAGQMEKLKTFNGLAATTSEEVAKDVWKGFQKGKEFIVTGKRMRALHRISGLIPYAIQQFLVRKEIKEMM